ncbi:MAG: ribosome assembly cofactor RimP [Flavobacteriaceae bacterium]|nr:ribosome assembly cofactor RimP [Flavobacteriaceae bacterium]
MIENKIVEKLVDEAIKENQELFLIEFKILPDNKITVIVDGDNGVTIKECMRISRHIEQNLDREEHDFALEVTSPGLSEALINKRQYKKNLGRTLKIKTALENFEGKLTRVDDKEIEIEWKVREPKPIGKGKVTVLKKRTLPFEVIKQTKVKLNF